MTENPNSDEYLYAAYHRGDLAAFDRLYACYRQPLYLFLLRRGHSETVAEDLFHDCWMRVLDRQSGFNGNNFRAWIFAIARNLSTDTFRRSSLRSATGFDENTTQAVDFSTQQVQEDMDCIELIKNSVAALPIEQRDAFLLKEEAGLTLQQLADLMAVGRETIKSRLRYAMKQLKQLMADCL